jgi:predicted cupin superfamily sugar epimerase
MTADEVKQHLNLTPHPREGGWFVRTYESPELLPETAFTDARYPSPRRTATAIFYLLEPDTFSEMHRLRSDEIFHFYLGDPVEMLQLHPSGHAERLILGNDLLANHHLQTVVPRHVWQGSRLLPGGKWALLGCTVSPGFEYEDYDSTPAEPLIAQWPDHQRLITALTRNDS